MRKRPASGSLALVTASAFGLAAILYWWRVASEGATTASLVAAIGFTVAAVLWIAIFVVSRLIDRRPNGREHDSE